MQHPTRPWNGDMGRRSHSHTLGLWANGERVGRWTLTARGGMELQYDPAWLGLRAASGATKNGWQARRSP